MAHYDYIVIGAGSAGCVIASRLGEDPKAKILVLEAGGPDSSYLYRRPGALGIVYQVPELKKKVDWGYATVPQRWLDDRRMPWTRGKVLGGCSTVNGMLYLRGHRDNYDEWRDMGNPGWGYDDVLPHFMKSECHEDGASDYHGADGPIRVTHQRGCSVVSEAFRESIAEVCGVPARGDFNAENQECAGDYHMTCAERRRYSTAFAFLHPAIKRGNVEAVIRALVTGLIIEGGRAKGVRYVVGGQAQKAYADVEVIVSAGTIGSPQILMLSGIGPADHLRDHGIDVVCDAPGVGSKLHDHLLVPLRFHATKDTGHTSTARHFIGGMLNDLLFRRGWFGKTFLETGAFVKSSAEQPRPDIQFMSIPWAYPEPNDDGPEPGAIATTPSFTMMPALIYPESRGELRLASADPAAAPLIDPHYLEDDRDMQLLMRGFELSREFAAAAPLAPYIKGEATPGDEVRSDEQIRAHIRRFAKTVYHPVGTCAMGPSSATTGPNGAAVVDHELRVHGVDGLRVADASIMPKIVGGNTNAPSIMIGEKAADMIRAAQ
jgi:choline dehydrogenase-like flavoprotein